MADAYGSGPYGSNTVWVQVPSPAWKNNDSDKNVWVIIFYAEEELVLWYGKNFRCVEKTG